MTVTLDFSQAVPVTPVNIEEKIQFYANKNGIPVQLALAQAKQESGFKTDAVSPKGAQGVFQLMPATAKELGVTNAFDPDQNIDAGTRYLKNLYDQYGDWKTALAAYNAGPGNVKKYGGVPPFEETQNYVNALSGSIPQVTLDFSKAVPIQQSTTPAPTPPQAPKAEGGPSEDPGAFKTLTRAAQNMQTLGVAPYVRAAANTLNPFRGSFSENLKAELETQKAGEQAHPIANAIGQGVGAIGGTAGGVFDKVSKTVAPVGSGLLRRGLGLGVGSAVLGQTQLPYNASLGDRGMNAGINVALGPVIEGVTTGLGKAGQLIFNKGKGAPGQFADDVFPDAIEAQATLASKGLPVPLSPSDATKGAGKGAVQGLFEASPFSRGVARNFGDKQNQALNRAAQWLEQRQGIPSIQKVGAETGLKLNKPSTELVDEALVAKTVSDQIIKKQQVFKASSAKLYSKVDDLAQGLEFAPENTLSSIALANKEISKGIGTGGRVGRFIKQFNKRFSPLEDIAASIDGSPIDISNIPGLKPVPKLQVSNLQVLRTQVTDAIGEATRAGSNNEARLLYKIKGGIDADLNALASKMDDAGNAEAARALKTANDFYRSGKERFKNEIFDEIQSLMGSEQSVATNKVISNAIKSGEYEKIVALKKVVGEEGFQPIKQSFVQNMLRGGKENYDLVGGTLKSQNNPLKQRLTKINPRVLNEMLGAEDATVLKALADIAPYAKSAEQALQNPRNIIRSAIGTGAVLGGGGVGGAAVGGVPGVALVAGAAVSNNLLARAFYSEPVRNLIISGYRPGLSGEALRQFSAGVVNALNQEPDAPNQ